MTSVYHGAVSHVDKWGNKLTPSDEVAAIRRESVKESDEFPSTEGWSYELCTCGHDLGLHTLIGFCWMYPCRCEVFVLGPRREQVA